MCGRGPFLKGARMFHPIGAAEKHAVAETASSNTKRTRARYH
jgi:hypothetical protein